MWRLCWPAARFERRYRGWRGFERGRLRDLVAFVAGGLVAGRIPKSAPETTRSALCDAHPLTVEFIMQDEDNFRFSCDEIEAVVFRPSNRFTKFSCRWKMEVRLHNGKRPTFVFANPGVPRSEIRLVQAFDVPVEIKD